MTLPRRALLTTGLGLGALSLAGSAAGAASPHRPGAAIVPAAVPAGEVGLDPNRGEDQTDALQRAIERAGERPIALPAGSYRVRTLKLGRAGGLIATGGPVRLYGAGAGPMLVSEGSDLAPGPTLIGLSLDGRGRALSGEQAGLVEIRGARSVLLRDLSIEHSLAHGLLLERVGGRIERLTIGDVAEAGIFSLDAQGLDIAACHLAGCGNNGILVWRSRKGLDGTTLTGNRIERIGASRGGNGPYGNGVNVFRADGVAVDGNRFDTAVFSAVRCNASSDATIRGNTCRQLGEVALYAEFGFEGALISGNLVDGASVGVSVTNFNEGGRLGLVEGNLIRNLYARREGEDNRGVGISVEADTSVVGNVIEGAPVAGIRLGYGPYLRDVIATGNLIRAARIGIGITNERGAGVTLVAGNIVSGAVDGAIRAFARDTPIGPDLTRAGLPPPGVTLRDTVVA